MYKHTHTINLFLSVFIPNCIFCLFIINKELLYFAICKDPVVKYLVAEVAYLHLCKWNYQFYAYIHCCLLRFSFWSHNMNNHVFSSENHVGLSKLYFSPCTCDMIQSFTGTCKFFYTDFSLMQCTRRTCSWMKKLHMGRIMSVDPLALLCQKLELNWN